MQSIQLEANSYYNARKRYGFQTARMLISFWNHFNIDEPESVDELVDFFLFGREVSR